MRDVRAYVRFVRAYMRFVSASEICEVAYVRHGEADMRRISCVRIN